MIGETIVDIDLSYYSISDTYLERNCRHIVIDKTVFEITTKNSKVIINFMSEYDRDEDSDIFIYIQNVHGDFFDIAE